MPEPEPVFAAVDTPGMALRLANIDRLRPRIEAARRTRPDLWPTIQEKLRVFWTADSNALEGSSLSRADTAFFLREGLTVEGKPLKDFLDARNHAEAIDHLGAMIHDAQPITPGFLKELNALLLKGVDRMAGRAGGYKTAPNHVLRLDGTIHHYLEPLQVPGAIERLCAAIAEAEASRIPHPVIVAALAHHEVARIHPFDDGNGRGARLLMNLLLLRAGYPPAVIPVERRRSYLEAIRAADQGEPEPFCAFIADALHATEEMIVGDLDALGGPSAP